MRRRDLLLGSLTAPILFTGCGGGGTGDLASNPIIKSILIGDGSTEYSQIYQCRNDIFPILPQGARYGYIGGNINKSILHFDNHNLANQIPTNNRMTIAMDIVFMDGYLTEHKGPGHMGLAARLSGKPYHKEGDNRGACIYFGTLQGDGTAVLEEIEITNKYQKIEWCADNCIVSEDIWHRIAIDSIVIDGKVGHIGRVWQKGNANTQWITINPADKASNIIWSDYPQNYNTTSNIASLFSIGNGGNFAFSNLICYYTTSDKMIQNP